MLAFHELRSSGAVVWDERATRWIVSGYGEVLQALRDRRLSADPTTPKEQTSNLPTNAPRRLSALQVLFTDPPDHGRLRKRLQPLFGPRATERRRAAIASMVEELLDTAAPAGRLEVMTQLALPLTRHVFLDVLEVPEEHGAQMSEWCSAIAPLRISPSGAHVTKDQADRAQRSFERLLEVTSDWLPGLSGELSLEELVANAVVFFHTAQKDTAQLIGTGLLALLQHRAVWSRLRGNPELIAAAVDEVLRYDGAINAASRRAREDIELGGQSIRRGQHVLLLLTAANRDAAHFPSPTVFDVSRPMGQHLSFGAGIHYCLGAPLARLQAELALTA